LNVVSSEWRKDDFTRRGKKSTLTEVDFKATWTTNEEIQTEERNHARFSMNFLRLHLMEAGIECIQRNKQT